MICDITNSMRANPGGGGVLNVLEYLDHVGEQVKSAIKVE